MFNVATCINFNCLAFSRFQLNTRLACKLPRYVTTRIFQKPLLTLHAHIMRKKLTTLNLYCMEVAAYIPNYKNRILETIFSKSMSSDVLTKCRYILAIIPINGNARYHVFLTILAEGANF